MKQPSMNEKAKINRANPRINMWWAGWWEPGYVEQSRYLYDHEFIVCTSGKSQVFIGEQSYTCTKGDVLIIPPGVRHWSRAFDESVERYCFHFDWERSLPVVTPSFVFESTNKYRARHCKPTPKWLGMKMPFYANGIPLQRLLPLLHPLVKCGGCSLENSFRQMGLFLQLFSEALSANQPVLPAVHGGKSLRLVQALKQRIELDYHRDFTINSLAKEFKVTSDHMGRAFRMTVGINPLEYVHRLRLEEAYQLLSDGSMNVSEVAGAVGFDDINYFSRLFKRKMGISPSAVAMSANPAPPRLAMQP